MTRLEFDRSTNAFPADVCAENQAGSEDKEAFAWDETSWLKDKRVHACDVGASNENT